MRMTTAILKQAQSRAPRHGRTKCDVTFRHRILSITATFLWTILFAITVPTAADAQSWWKQLEDTGKKIIDRTIDKINRPSEGQQEQQKLPPQPPKTTPAPQPPSDSEPSYTRAQVREVQRLLIDLGYKPGPVDGAYGTATGTAIRAYQADHGLPRTGVPSSELLAHLRSTHNAQPAAATTQAPTQVLEATPSAQKSVQQKQETAEPKAEEPKTTSPAQETTNPEPVQTTTTTPEHATVHTATMPQNAAPPSLPDSPERRACEKGDVKNCVLLGSRHQRGHFGFEHNLAFTRYYYGKACEFGDIEDACGKYAGMLQNGTGGPMDVRGAIAVFEKICVETEGKDCFNLEVRAESRATSLYERHCANGAAWGCFKRGYRYRYHRDEANARAYYKRACDLKDYRNGCKYYAESLSAGLGGPKDLEGALRLYDEMCAALDQTSCTLGQTMRNMARSNAQLKAQGQGAASRPSSNQPISSRRSSHTIQGDALRAKCDAGDDRSCRSVATRWRRSGDEQELANVRDYIRKACAESVKDTVGWCFNYGSLLEDEHRGFYDREGAAQAYQEGCNKGSAHACMALKNVQYNVQRAQKGDQARAEALAMWETQRKSYDEQCTRGSTQECIKLAIIYQTGQFAHLGHLSIGPDPAMSRKYYGLACDHDDIRSGCMAYAERLENGYGGPKDPEGALRAYDKACNAGWDNGCYRGNRLRRVLGMETRSSTDERQAPIRPPSSQPNRRLHTSIRDDGLKIRCDAGDEGACMRLMTTYKRSGDPQLNTEAREYFGKACAHSIEDTMGWCSSYGSMLELGKGGAKDPEGAIKAYKEGCDKRNSIACSNLRSLQSRLNNAQEAEQARTEGPAKWESMRSTLDEQCASGNTRTCMNLANVYQSGYFTHRGQRISVGRDEALTRKYYKLACDHGDLQTGCMAYTNMTQFGRGGPVDKEETLKTYRKMCAGGMEAICTMASMLEKQIGK